MSEKKKETKEDVYKRINESLKEEQKLREAAKVEKPPVKVEKSPEVVAESEESKSEEET